MSVGLKRLGRLVRAVVREHTKSLRSSKWAGVRRQHLAFHPLCAACGGKRLLQVHHVVPFSDRPELELDAMNLVTLCMGKHECHLMIGHGDNFRCFNPDVLLHASEVLSDPQRRGLIESAAERCRLDKP